MPGPPTPPSAPTPCVVAINDDATFLTMLSEMLALRGYACRTILHRDLGRALARLRAEAPAAIILDVRLGHPEEGWAVRDRLKGDPVLGVVPLIMCSADARALERRAKELAAAGDAILPKPFVMGDLFALLTCILAGQGPTDPTSAE